MNLTLGLAVIAKDEESTLPSLLASIEGCFDQVALLDTGSTDRTVDIFEKWASGQSQAADCRLGHFAWCDDFAAARNAADDLLDTDWLCWADCDDEIVGAGQLRVGLSTVPPHVKALFFPYQLVGGEEMERMRLRRRSVDLRWHGRLHEGLPYEHLPASAIQYVPRGQHVHWVHRRGASHDTREGSRERNREILRRWVRDERDNPCPLGQLAAQEFTMGSPQVGITHLERYMEIRPFPLPGHREEAEAALDELRSGWRRYKGVDEAEPWFNPLLSTILGRKPQEWFTSLPAERDLRPQPPKSRQVRRAEERARRKAERRQLVGAA